MSFLAQYHNAVKERAEQNVPPLPLSKEQATQLCELLIKEPSPELVSLLENRVSPGVDDAALVKCEFLDKILKNELNAPSSTRRTPLKR